MIQSLFQYLRPSIENNKIHDLKRLLKKTAAYSNGFEDIFLEFGDVEGERIATFVIFMYSPDSSFFIASDNYADTKSGIAELCGLNIEQHRDILLLKNVGVVKAVNFVGSEIKSWKYRKMINYREAAAHLEKLSTQEPNEKKKNAAKEIRDAAVFAAELNEKADILQEQIFKQTKSPERIKEMEGIDISTISMERILKDLERNKTN